MQTVQELLDCDLATEVGQSFKELLGVLAQLRNGQPALGYPCGGLLAADRGVTKMKSSRPPARRPSAGANLEKPLKPKKRLHVNL